MKKHDHPKLVCALLGSLFLAMIGTGCEQSAPAAPPQVTPSQTTPTTSPTYQPYFVGKNYQFVLYSPAFAVADSIASITTYDNNGNAVNPWTLVTVGPNAPSQNMTTMTFTILVTAVNPTGLPAGQTRVKPNVKAGAFTTTGPPSSGTVVVTTTNNVTIPIPVMQVNVDPCGLN